MSENPRTSDTSSTDTLVGSVRFVTVCSDAFAPGLAILLTSLRRHFAHFAATDFVVIHHRDVSPLAASTRTTLADLFPNVRFEEPDLSDYPQLVAREGHAPDVLYLTFEAFRTTDARRVIFVDSDMLVLGDFSEVVRIDRDFLACATGSDPVAYPGPDRNSGTINSGFFVVGQEHLDGRTFDALIDRLTRNLRGAARDDSLDLIRDQAIINAVIPIDRIHVLPNTYNFRSFPHLAHFVDVAKDIRILHFSGYWFRPKPWDPAATPECLAYRLWAEAAVDAVTEAPALESLIPGYPDLRTRLDAVRDRTRTAMGILQTLRADVGEDLVAERYRYGDTALNRLRARTPAWLARLARVATGATTRANEPEKPAD